MKYLKVLLRKAAELIVSNDAVWYPICRTLVRGSQFLCSVRDIYEVEQIIKTRPELMGAFNAKKVISGPFAGMNYRNTSAFCSALHPKILGTYEFELTDIINSALKNTYTTIVDVGAADGYYAVGFAFRTSKIKVIAFEQDERARRELAKLIAVNQVNDRVFIKGKCEPADLLDIPRERGLIIMDCEGYEEILLIPEVIEHFKDWDFIIETHDGFYPEITKRLAGRFLATHNIKMIEVIHDQNKADFISLPILQQLPRKDINKLLAENRQHACMRWISCESMSSTANS